MDFRVAFASTHADGFQDNYSKEAAAQSVSSSRNHGATLLTIARQQEIRHICQPTTKETETCHARRAYLTNQVQILYVRSTAPALLAFPC